MGRIVIHNYPARDARRRTRDDDDPCWEGFEQRGTKEKNGRTVPNCVPTSDALEHELRAASPRPA